MDYLLLDKQIDDILNGTRNISQFNQPEHAGICSAGPLLVGALIVCDNARESLGSGRNAVGSEETVPNWKIDAEQELQVQEWAEEKGVWIPQAEEWLNDSFGEIMPLWAVL